MSTCAEVYNTAKSKGTKVYFEIACNDQAKAQLLKENGFEPWTESRFTSGDLTVQTTKYSRQER